MKNFLSRIHLPSAAAALTACFAFAAPAAAASDGLADPGGLAMGADGSVYVADTGNDRVVVLDDSAEQVGGWGSRGTYPRRSTSRRDAPAGGTFSGPTGIAVDGRGDVYVADTGNFRIQRFSADGSFERQWGRKGRRGGRMLRPTDVAAGPGGRIYVADARAHRILRFRANGKFVRAWKVRAGRRARGLYPWGVAVGDDGTVHATLRDRGKIQSFSPGGKKRGTLAKGLSAPLGLDAGDDRVLAADRSGVRSFTAAGDETGSLTEGGDAPLDVTEDGSTGAVFVASSSGVEKLAGTGETAGVHHPDCEGTERIEITGALSVGEVSGPHTVGGLTFTFTGIGDGANEDEATAASFAVSGGTFTGTIWVKGGPQHQGNDFTDATGGTVYAPVNEAPKRYAISHIDLCITGSPPPPPPPPPPSADVRVSKSASAQTARPGDLVTYTVKATNAGPDAAQGVVVTDQLPAGVTFVSADPPCESGAGSEVTCTFGTLGSGASATGTFTVRVDLVTAQPTDHLIGVQKVEQFVGLSGGETRSASLSCPDGFLMTDASARFDSVDQGTGTPADLDVREARSDSLGSYAFQLRNGATGQTQVHLFGVCVSARSTDSDGHAHDLAVGGPVSDSFTFGSGTESRTLECPAGTQPIAPSFRVLSGSARSVTSEPGPGASGWTLGFAADAAATVEASIRCLERTVSTAGGHSGSLDLTHVDRTVTIPPGQTVDETISCSDQAKGIVATYDLPPGGQLLGHTPVPKSRIFRLYNPTSEPISAKIDLVCMGDRLGGTPGPFELRNTARVASSTADANPANDSSTHVLLVEP